MSKLEYQRSIKPYLAMQTEKDIHNFLVALFLSTLNTSKKEVLT